MNVQEFFNPDILKEKLLIISSFISVYENFKTTIVEEVKFFYLSGINSGKPIFRDYDEKVLNKVTSAKNKTIKATLLWFKEAGAINDNDI